MAGLSLASRRVVTLLGLGTASRPYMLTRHRSGVLAPTETKQLVSSISRKKPKSQPD